MLSEREVEVRVEKMLNKLELKFIGGNLSKKEYDDELALITKWADEQYKKFKSF